MSLKEKIIEKLISSSFKNFIEGVEEASDNVKDLDWDQELLERVLSIFIYNKAYKHEELVQAFEVIGKDFPACAQEILEGDKIDDLYTKGQITGLSVFLSKFGEGLPDISGFFMTSGFVYQIAANGCTTMIELADATKWPELCKSLKDLADIFNALWEKQMYVSSMISDIEEWDEELATAFTNILYESDFESRTRMLKFLSDHNSNNVVMEKIVEPYRTALETAIGKNNSETVDTIKNALEELNKLF